MKKARLTSSVYEADDEFISAHFQPAVLVELASSRDVSDRDLFRGVRLNAEQIKSAQKNISPDQFLTLINNAQRLMQVDDVSFLFGQRLLPGFYGACSQSFQMMSNCRQVLEHLCDYHAILSPLLTPRIFENDKYLFLYWQDCVGGNAAQQKFLVEAYMMAVTSVIDWLAGYKLPWQFQFRYDEPSYIEQYWVNLGHEVSFNRQLNMLVIEKRHTEKNWSQPALLGGEAFANASRHQLDQLGVANSFLDEVYQYLLEHIDQTINLDRLSEAFLLSPSSMKRKLKKHKTGFQEQLDLARRNTAMQLFYVQDYTYQQIAEHLRFNDMNNFRRSFKRWTGFSPSTLYDELSV